MDLNRIVFSSDEHGASNLFIQMWTEKMRSALEGVVHCRTNPNESFAYISKVVKESLSSPRFRVTLRLSTDVVNNERANMLNQNGMFYVESDRKQYIMALKCYNESIAYTEALSHERARTYVNRSVVCLLMEHYEECLENIMLARECSNSTLQQFSLQMHEHEAKRGLVKNLERNARSSVTTKQDPADGLRLSYPSHTHELDVANCLSLKRNDQYGRHVVTSRKLKVGDVVMIDKPFVTMAGEHCRYLRCDYCLRERPFTLIPCDRCTWVMYCSRTCLSKAFNEYHRYECGILRDLQRIGGPMLLMALRVTARTIAIFGGSLETFQAHVDELYEPQVNGFTMNASVATFEEMYNMVHVLATNQERRQCRDIAVQLLHAHVIHTMVLERTELRLTCQGNPERQKILFDMILRHLQIVLCNRMPLSCMEYKPFQMQHEMTVYGLACYPLVSMLNHSCASNVKRITLRDGRCAIIVVRPIAEGGQLFTNCSVHHFTNTRRIRQTVLKCMYHFDCNCEACSKNYPMLRLLYPLHIANALKMYVLNRNRQRKRASEIMKRTRIYLNRTAKRYPSKHRLIAQYLFEQSCMNLYQDTSEVEKC
uniref:MYND-type domain-containing protein n=1 Tax=Anopheles epiroticus TaxID=199890 RepID=A0A182PJ03_9DIPT